MTGIKIQSIEGPDELGVLKVTVTPDSIPLLEKMFPSAKTPEEAFRSYWSLATNHIITDQTPLDLQVTESQNPGD